MSSFKSSATVKEQIEYSDILFKQIDRIGMIASQPDLNLSQFGTSVDILAGMVSFLGDIGFKANPTLPADVQYKKIMMAFEKIIKLLNEKNLLFKYRIRGHIGESLGESGNP